MQVRKDGCGRNEMWIKEEGKDEKGEDITDVSMHSFSTWGTKTCRTLSTVLRGSLCFQLRTCTIKKNSNMKAGLRKVDITRLRKQISKDGL